MQAQAELAGRRGARGRTERAVGAHQQRGRRALHLETRQSIERMVACLTITEGRVRTKALEILSCLVLLTDQPVIERALRNGSRSPRRRATPATGAGRAAWPYPLPPPVRNVI